MERSALRQIPSVDRILRQLGPQQLPRPLVLHVVREVLDNLRQNRVASADAPVDLLPRIRREIDALVLQKLQIVINGTGIIIHTNFGRSPLGRQTAGTAQQAATRYNNLEFDLATGERSQRAAYLELTLPLLCQSEAATVVNNCAAALVLVLRALTPDKTQSTVVVSRGELVQIGGGFRIPDILEASGVSLREVGTTNRTTLDDYRRAIDDSSAMILKVHQSNFYMGGFTEACSTAALAALARERNIPLVEDLGSGATFDTASLGPTAEHEPTPAQVLRDGASLVTFSGDKLLGGPQAGIIAGKKDLVTRLKRHPFFRALRCDKLILAALQQTIDIHLEDNEAKRQAELPIFAMMRHPIEFLQDRANRLLQQLDDLPLLSKMGEGDSQIGGGSLPRTTIPSITLDLAPRPPDSVDALARRLRLAPYPVVGYIADQRLRLDLRTIFSDQDTLLIQSLRAAATPP